MNLPTNYLALEPLLLARILATLGLDSAGGALAGIGGVAEFEAALENDGPYPSAFVLYDGEQVAQSGHSGRRMLVTQLWQVCLLTRPTITAATGAASLAASGTLLSSLIDALSGWTPAGGYQAMKRIQARGQSVVYANGLAMFVLDFEVGVPVVMGEGV